MDIKFRLYDGEENFMYYSDEFDSLGEFFIFKETHYKKCELNQYTGLNDKNGKEIYEGDIVLLDNTIKKEKVIYHVSNGQSGFYPFLFREYHWSSKKSEVIGNIYENPELLKGE